MYRRKNRQNEIPVELEDVEIILDKEFPGIHVFLNSAFCEACSGQTTVEAYTIFLDDVNDLIFEGRCSKCKAPVARYVETGESRSAVEAARHIRIVKKLAELKL